MNDHPRTEENAGVGRRQLLRATAWAAPVVLLAAPLPAAAASTATGVLTVVGFRATTNQFPGVIAWPVFSIHYEANGGVPVAPVGYVISTSPATQNWQSSNFSLGTGQSEDVGSGATLPLAAGTYRLVVTVTSSAAATVIAESDPITV